MTQPEKRFNAQKQRIIFEETEPELFELAESALFNREGRSVFEYDGTWWMVATEVQNGRLAIWPESQS